MRIVKLVTFSDVHNRQEALRVPDGDIAICAGDATNFGNPEAINAFLTWMGELPHQHKIFIAGNHDILFEKEPGLAKQMCRDNGIIYLEDSGVEIMGIKFWGSPVTPWFMGERWAFNRARNFAEEAFYKARPIKPHWDAIPDDTDVLITHGPPYEILDASPVEASEKSENPACRYIGCVDLRDAVRRVKPDVHIFGHVHYSFGEAHIDGTSFFNVAVVDRLHIPSNGCTVIDYVIEEEV